MPSEQRGRLSWQPAWSSWSASLVAAGLGFLGCNALSLHVSLWPLGSYAIGFACVVAASLLVACAVPRPRRPHLLIVMLVVVVLELVRRQGAVGLGASFSVLLALLAAGSVLGALVGSGIEHPGHLLFVALVSALADTFSVTQPEGPSAAIVQAPQVLALLALPWPMLGTGQITPFLGVGDVLFTSLYVAAARTHALPARRTLLALAAAYFATMAAVLATALPIPALPFLGFAMLIAHPASRLPPVRDRRRGFAVVCVMVLAFGALLARRML
ncbi:MAG TPA: hypothetical protein VF331_07025 [Polyangiales bacterium]